jgi:hypothetical protein
MPLWINLGYSVDKFSSIFMKTFLFCPLLVDNPCGIIVSAAFAPAEGICRVRVDRYCSEDDLNEAYGQWKVGGNVGKYAAIYGKKMGATQVQA